MAIINGNNANNVLIGTALADTINGLAGIDLLLGLGGNDLLNGGIGADTMLGGFGNDVYIVDNPGDFVFEDAGAGFDTIISLISNSLNTASRANVENLTLSGGAVVGVGNALSNTLNGNALNNTLSGLDGNDALFGLGGTDTLLGGNGNDRLDGGIGVDNMQGGFGNDVYVVDNGADFVFEAAGAGIDTIVSSINTTLNIASRANVENLTLIGGAVVGVGNALGNLIVGNALNNNLMVSRQRRAALGLAGNDALFGGIWE